MGTALKVPRLTMGANGSFGVRLCRGRYSILTLPETVSIDLLCQEVGIDGRSFVWVDGIDHAEPILIPKEDLNEVEHLGTLGQYLRDERHIGLGEHFDDLLDLCLSRDLSATMLVRACEFMHSDGLDASGAVSAASEWGCLVQEMDWGRRACREYELGKTPARPNESQATL